MTVAPPASDVATRSMTSPRVKKSFLLLTNLYDSLLRNRISQTPICASPPISLGLAPARTKALAN
jgi:hypothetical protein